MPRPVTTYTDEVADEICTRLMAGEPLRAICRDEHMPAWRTVYHWMEANAGFSARIARARDTGTDALAESLLDVVHGREGSTGDVQRDKLIADATLKLLSKWNPKRYGDNATIQHEHSGSVDLVGRLAAGRQRIAQIQRVEQRQISGVVEAEVVDSEE